MQRVRFLIDRGAWVRGSGSLREAARTHRNELAKLLVDIGADIEDVGNDSARINPNRQNALIAAAEAGNEAIVRWLLQNGADVNYHDQSGQTAKEIAEKGDYPQIARILDIE